MILGNTKLRLTVLVLWRNVRICDRSPCCTCSHSRIMCESYAYGLNALISSIKDNFSHLTHKSTQIVLKRMINSENRCRCQDIFGHFRQCSEVFGKPSESFGSRWDVFGNPGHEKARISCICLWKSGQVYHGSRLNDVVGCVIRDVLIFFRNCHCRQCQFPDWWGCSSGVTRQAASIHVTALVTKLVNNWFCDMWHVNILQEPSLPPMPVHWTMVPLP